MTTQISKSTTEKIKSLLLTSTKGLIEAGELIAAMIDENPEGAIDIICADIPGLTPEIVLNLERLGRKTLHPQLLIADGPGVRRLRKLGYSYQEKFIKEPIPVVLKNGGHCETLLMECLNLTEGQAAQVFASDHIRSEAEQRAWIEDAAAKALPIQTKVNLPYRTAGGKLVVMVAGTTFTRKELARILSDMD